MLPLLYFQLWRSNYGVGHWKARRQFPLKMTVTSALANVGSKIDGPFVVPTAIILFVMDKGLRNKHVLVDLIYGILGVPTV